VLFENAVQGGSKAAGLPLTGIALGQRADLVEIDLTSNALLGIPIERLLDAMIFSTPSFEVRNVFVAGKKRTQQNMEWKSSFLKTMLELQTFQQPSAV
jgi:formimidoylglutamate deiminase